MHKLEVKLKQHTPLIHFQHDQEGATLRASEVKPKLDKFILSQLGEGDYLAGVSKAKDCGWLIGKGDHRALNYKLAIQSGQKDPSVQLQYESKTNRDNVQKYYSFWKRYDNGRTEEFPMLLSNMGGKDSPDELINFSLYKDNVLTIICKYKELSDMLSSSLCLFFASNNFGQRSSKGFGSFSVSSINGNQEKSPLEFLNDVFYLRFSLPGKTNLESQCKIFQTIDFYWKCLKSGINYTRNGQYPKRYIKAYLWTYLNNKDLTWEKRKIKEHFHLLSGEEKNENSNTASFARAIMGCPDKFEYKNFNRTVAIRHDLDENNPDYIARIPSPIIFKPVIEDGVVEVLIIYDRQPINELRGIPSEHLDFKFSCDGNSMNMRVDPQSIKLKTLIKTYHNYIYNTKLGSKAFNNEEEYDDYVSENELDESIWFFPLDFNWKRITKDPVVIRYIR